MTGSLWVSWKNRILGNGDAGAFDRSEAHVLKSPPDPTYSCALRTRGAQADTRAIVVHGIGVYDPGWNRVAVRAGDLDRIGQTPVAYPPDPSDGDAADTPVRWLNRDRDNAPMADIGG